jgi:hypothetical protein
MRPRTAAHDLSQRADTVPVSIVVSCHTRGQVLGTEHGPLHTPPSKRALACHLTEAGVASSGGAALDDYSATTITGTRDAVPCNMRYANRDRWAGQEEFEPLAINACHARKKRVGQSFCG